MQKLSAWFDRNLLLFITFAVLLVPFYLAYTVMYRFTLSVPLQFLITGFFIAFFVMWWLRGKDYVLEAAVLFLLVFIPLYPKFPLIDIAWTWTYIRFEDFLIAFFVGVLLVEILRRRAVLDQKVGLPILFYWAAGAVSALLAIIFLRGTIAYFPHLTALHYLRRIEYMALFFLGFAAVRNVSTIRRASLIIILSVVVIIAYGLLQKYLRYPVFSTMNEEFAKGMVLYLDPVQGRVISTFAGHYDLAAYMVLVLPILFALLFAVKNYFAKITLLVVATFAYWVLLLTFSRVSYGAYFVALGVVILLQRFVWWKKALVLVLLFVLSFAAGSNVAGLSDRLSKVARFNEVISDWNITFLGKKVQLPTATSSAELVPISDLPPVSSPSATTVLVETPEGNMVVVEQTLKPGEVPTATSAASTIGRIATPSAESPSKQLIITDRSFDIRLKKEWPDALNGFLFNPLFGKGYATLTQTKGQFSTDGDYFRMLGETGLLGFSSFLFIFVVLAVLVVKALRWGNLDTFSYAFVTGVTAGVAGTLANATLIDIFEASKFASVFWLLVGLAAGIIVVTLRASTFKRPR